MTKAKKVTTAAGTVTLRRRPDGPPRLLLVHRPQYDDWVLPKGKLRPDEYEAAAALRETREEAGVRVRLGVPAGSITYPVDGVPKTVHFWEGVPLDVRRRKPDREVDKVAWLTPDAACSACGTACGRVCQGRRGGARTGLRSEPLQPNVDPGSVGRA